MEQTFEARFLSARRAVIAARFQNLNDMQREGVLTTQGPLLLLAGAGSGKTTVLINRIANLIAFGEGSDSNEIPEYIAEEDVTYLEDYLKTRDPALPARLLSYRSVGTQAGLLLCLRCEAQEGTGEQKRCLAAFSPTPVSDGGSYHALIGGEIG